MAEVAALSAVTPVPPVEVGIPIPLTWSVYEIQPRPQPSSDGVVREIIMA